MQIQIRIQSFLSWMRSLQVRIRIRIQEKQGGFGFKSRFEIFGSDHTTTICHLLPIGAFYIQLDLNPDSDSKQLNSDSDSRKKEWIRIQLDSDSRWLDSDPDSRCLDSHITGPDHVYWDHSQTQVSVQNSGPMVLHIVACQQGRVSAKPPWLQAATC